MQPRLQWCHSNSSTYSQAERQNNKYPVDPNGENLRYFFFPSFKSVLVIWNTAQLHRCWLQSRKLKAHWRVSHATVEILTQHGHRSFMQLDRANWWGKELLQKPYTSNRSALHAELRTDDLSCAAHLFLLSPSARACLVNQNIARGRATSIFSRHTYKTQNTRVN